MSQVTISAFKRHLSAHLRRAEAGEVIDVLDRTRPIVRVVPIGIGDDGLEVMPPSRPFASVRSIRLPALDLRSRREQETIQELFGKVEMDPSYDYKEHRRRR